MKIVSIVGARPQFIKAAAVSRALRVHHQEYLVHTGQHYDERMSAVFFEELDIPAPKINLEVGSGLHGAQTAAMLSGIEQVLLAQKPDWVLVYGDTNSTLAGALAAAKLHIPAAHVEAGLRSFNRNMPEEVNRIVADHTAQLLLCPSQAAMDNLAREGIQVGARLVGDVMADALIFAVECARTRTDILTTLNLHELEYYLATVHRAENTDDPARLGAILHALDEIEAPVIFPVHPRTQAAMERFALRPRRVRLIAPLGYLDMARLESAAHMILTDSGGVQKEAYWLGVPCVTLREETEWVETVALGWNRLAGADKARILDAARDFPMPGERPQLYGDGRSSERCVAALEQAARRQ
jgi:UDP-N-acetylglucosamine 2-epimerase